MNRPEVWDSSGQLTSRSTGAADARGIYEPRVCRRPVTSGVRRHLGDETWQLWTNHDHWGTCGPCRNRIRFWRSCITHIRCLGNQERHRSVEAGKLGSLLLIATMLFTVRPTTLHSPTSWPKGVRAIEILQRERRFHLGIIWSNCVSLMRRSWHMRRPWCTDATTFLRCSTSRFAFILVSRAQGSGLTSLKAKGHSQPRSCRRFIEQLIMFRRGVA
jgi:hypothetical protein